VGCFSWVIMIKDIGSLAINGGDKIRHRVMPPRQLFAEAELAAVRSVFFDSWAEGQDFGYQGKFENIYTQKFCEFQGGGYADAVSSGTAAVYIALQALQLRPGSSIAISPVTDPGAVSPIVLQGFKPVIVDSCIDSFNIDPEQLENVLVGNNNISAVVITHVGGWPTDIQSILAIAAKFDVHVIEDCSQSHGAMYERRRVGTFGNIAVFSTMYSKIHATGGCGGLVYTQDKWLYDRIRSFADRGKLFHLKGFDSRDPRTTEHAALNFNLDELSCAIGASTLDRLESTINARLVIAQKFDIAFEGSELVSPAHRLSTSSNVPAYYFYTARLDAAKLRTSKAEFCRAIEAEGIPLNAQYNYLAYEWPWLKPHLTQESSCSNARKFRDITFNIPFHEKYTDDEVKDIRDAVMKVESFFGSNS